MHVLMVTANKFLELCGSNIMERAVICKIKVSTYANIVVGPLNSIRRKKINKSLVSAILV